MAESETPKYSSATCHAQGLEGRCKNKCIPTNFFGRSIMCSEHWAIVPPSEKKELERWYKVNFSRQSRQWLYAADSAIDRVHIILLSREILRLRKKYGE